MLGSDTSPDVNTRFQCSRAWFKMLDCFKIPACIITSAPWVVVAWTFETVYQDGGTGWRNTSLKASTDQNDGVNPVIAVNPAALGFCRPPHYPFVAPSLPFDRRGCSSLDTPIMNSLIIFIILTFLSSIQPAHVFTKPTKVLTTDIVKSILHYCANPFSIDLINFNVRGPSYLGLTRSIS